MSGCTGCPKGGGDKAWFLPVRARLFATRARKAVRHARKGRWELARLSLSPKPSIVCTCTGWTECRAYYLKGWYTYCPSCGTYAPC